MMNFAIIKKNFVLKFLVIFFGFFIPVSSNFAQSGRSIPTPEATPEPTPVTESKNENPICEKNENEVEFMDLSERDEFIKRINRYGSCGYRLEKIARFPLLGDETPEQMSFTGLVKKDKKNKYEYSWFIAQTPGQAQTLSNNLAENGFYLKKAMSFTVGSCGEKAHKIRKENDKDEGILGKLANLTIGDQMIFFLFERKVGSSKKNEYRIIDAEIPNSKFRENQRKMQDLTAKGFRPVELWYLGFLQYHFVIMEKDEDIKPQGEYIFDKELYGVSKDLTKYAEKGYNLLIMGTGLSVLNRTSSTPQNVKYHSFHNFNKVQKNLPAMLKNATLVETGNDFYPVTCDAFENRWFFTTPLNDEKNIPKKDIILLSIGHIKDEFRNKNAVPEKIPLTKEQIIEIEKETTGRINQLLKDNYEVINFNYLDGYTFMFERLKK